MKKISFYIISILRLCLNVILIHWQWIVIQIEFLQLIRPLWLPGVFKEHTWNSRGSVLVMSTASLQASSAETRARAACVCCRSLTSLCSSICSSFRHTDVLAHSTNLCKSQLQNCNGVSILITSWYSSSFTFAHCHFYSISWFHRVLTFQIKEILSDKVDLLFLWILS